MEFENELATFRRGGNVDVGLLSDANLVAETEDDVSFAVGVESQVVESTICESIAVI